MDIVRIWSFMLAVLNLDFTLESPEELKKKKKIPGLPEEILI